MPISGTATRPALPLRLAALRKAPAAADGVLILTSLSAAEADAAKILERYRLRWRIECAFTRLKRLLHLEALRAFDPDLVQTYLLAKLLGS